MPEPGAFAASRRGFLRHAGAALTSAALFPTAMVTPWAAAASGRRFRTAKVGKRWVFVTPEGHPYWMLGVFNVDMSTSQFAPRCSYRSEALAKYGSEAVWARQAVRRLRSWGFNCLAEYASEYALPVPLYGRPGNRERMPFVAMIRPSAFSLANRWGYAPAPVQNIVAATDPAVYTGWRGALPDVFDPNFSVYAAGEAKALAQHLGRSSFLAGVATDDLDDLYGFGPGPAIAAARTHPHIGWLVLVARPGGKSHPRLCSKYALRDALQRRYGNIAALNRAWQADYTSFDSAGGWPQGRGLLDESGRNPWVSRDPERLAGAPPALVADLDDFLGQFAQTYFQSVTRAVRTAFPGYLVFGPATLNSWNGLTRVPILRAAGASLDVVQANLGSAEILNQTTAAIGDVPIVTWTGFAANQDSDLFAFPDPPAGAPACDTQSLRGAAYAQAVADQFAATAASGIYPVVGTKFWGFTDSWPEKMNWGLVSFRDNAYDGRQAIRARGRDPWHFPTGGEVRDYGDCLSPIQSANRSLYDRLQKELLPGAELRPADGAAFRWRGDREMP